MNDREDKFESYEKPTRVQRHSKKQKRAKDRGELEPKEPYKRQRFNPREFDTEDFDD